MKTYVFVYHARNNDRSGNPRNQITVYRIKKNRPIRLGEPKENVGYRDREQAAKDIILQNEPGWSKKIIDYNNGFRAHSVEQAHRDGKICLKQL